jgi:spermidine/putrescine transport system ATP-binding protein
MSNPDRGTVHLSGISKRFGDVAAVERLDLAIASGEFLALLGSSGCGKTTTLRMVGGFEQPDVGRIVIGGVDVTSTPPHRRDVNTVFQQYALFPHMTVAENVGYGLVQRRVPAEDRRARVSEVLTQVAMAAFAGRRPSELSGGQQQRVALARALVNRPAVLLLDEPLGALDRQLRQQMQIELKQIQRRLGMTFLYVTHDQEEALAMADRIAVMHEGRLEQVGSPADVYDRPVSAFVAGFVGLQNFFIGERLGSRTMQAGAWKLTSATTIDTDSARAADPTMTAAVRPESIRFVAEAMAPGENRAHGTLVAVQPLGDTLQYVVDADGCEIVVRHPRAAAVRAVRLGETLWCAWDSTAVQLFPGRAAARHARASRGGGGKGAGGLT